MPTNFEFIFHANRRQISELISKQICFQICQTQLNMRIVLTNKAKKNETFCFLLFFINSF